MILCLICVQQCAHYRFIIYVVFRQFHFCLINLLFFNSGVISDPSFYVPNNYLLHAAFPGLSSDRVGVGQRWTHRADGGKVHGPPENHPARLVPEHGRRGDVAERHVAQKGSEVGGPNTGPFGWVSACAQELTGTNTHTHTHVRAHTQLICKFHLWINHAEHRQTCLLQSPDRVGIK